jgi:hypothetical protein
LARHSIIASSSPLQTPFDQFLDVTSLGGFPNLRRRRVSTVRHISKLSPRLVETSTWSPT